jgi:polar amino acid transport system permease protein
MSWNWHFVQEILPLLLSGAIVTVEITAIGSTLAMVVGLMLTVLRRSRRGLVSDSVSLIVKFLRGTPLLVQLYFLFYVLPDVGIKLSPLTAGVIGLGFHYATYTSEVYRAGIDNISAGQWEAAKTINLSSYHTWRYVIIPQAVPPMIPALANYVVAMFKETPLLSTITVLELMGEARVVANFNYRYLEPMTLVGAFFLLISAVSVIGLRSLETISKPKDLRLPY